MAPCQTNRCRVTTAAARGPNAPGGGGVVYWVITPEVNTDSVVGALRRSWLKGAADDARFCVASGMSKSKDPSLHWLHGLNRSGEVASGRADLNKRLINQHNADTSSSAAAAAPPSAPAKQATPQSAGGDTEAAAAAAASRPRSEGANAAREAGRLKKKRDASSREITRVYNNFLRHKVFEIMREMCRTLKVRPFEVAFMMDADTAVNRSNLERFVARMDPAAPVYTGLCKRRSTWASGSALQRGVGGGPGIILSRPLLSAVCPSLEQCAPLRSMMDKLQFAGGDLMLAKCMEFLGHYCKLEREIPFTRAAERYEHEQELLHERKQLGNSGDAVKISRRANGPGSSQRLDDLFRRGPPWVYPPLGSGTILVATRRSAGAKAIEQYERIRTGGLPPSSVISFHRVRPSLRSDSWKQDPRCRVFAEYTRLESGPAHWTSRCLPNFVLIGSPKSGTTSLFNWVLQHPDLRAPVRKELHFWAPVLTPEKNCADRADCAAMQSKTRPPSWPLTKLTASRLLTAYLELFPRIDPREYSLTGEGSPAYLYSPSAALFLESSLLAHIKLLVLLRDPTERAFSEYKNKRDLMVKGAPKAKAWVNSQPKFGPFVAALRADTEGCTPKALYAACETCARFAAAPGSPDAKAQQSNASSRNGSTSASGGASCVVPPVIWQSWYHLFLPRFMKHGPRLLVEFSDDMFKDPNGMMSRVGSFLSLPGFNYSTSVAYNTEKKRGAYIAPKSVSSTTGSGDSTKGSSKRAGNEASAANAAAQRTSAAGEDMAVIRQLMRHSVSQLQVVMADERWQAPAQQLRRAVPSEWRLRYGLPPAPARTSESEV